MKDKHGKSIELGDILDSDDGYAVIVCEYEDGGWFGKLIPDRYFISEYDASGLDIPYALNEGRGYTKRMGEIEAEHKVHSQGSSDPRP